MAVRMRPTGPGGGGGDGEIDPSMEPADDVWRRGDEATRPRRSELGAQDTRAMWRRAGAARGAAPVWLIRRAGPATGGVLRRTRGN